MDKVYRLLPWLSLDQAVDWLRRLTKAEITSDILLCLCEAGRTQAYVNVGTGCSGTDEDSWLLSVHASGYHSVTNQEQLRFALKDQQKLLLYGQVMVFAENGDISKREIHWFPSFPCESIHPVFKSAHVQALADTINAEELAEKELEIEAIRASLAKYRMEKETALLELHNALAENCELRDKLAQVNEIAAQATPAESPKTSYQLAIAGLLTLLLDNARPRYNQGSAATAIGDKGWPGASATAMNHMFAEANKTAKEAETIAQSKAEARAIALRASTLP